ncbi:metal ABC transporter solute-binding protein, Zn/Mn family [Rhodococcus xishaensis]|uniref:ABC transporter permease n=1 Tax=Rhodococcus xishaensis TaxID=2487364 RepID=A0A438APJ8_9NOCA|nr:zinc ABC transporter substrate-binding protein [Rhodococcus xishaensis]RVW00590.1 ABC transporter permease [Rhodococcus xishaensis]
MRISRKSLALRSATVAAGATLAAAFLTACGSSPDADGQISVVASTNVWGSVAQAVAGDRLEVTSIITEPSADPHSYEASPSDAAKIVDASLVVLNGGGYDQFVEDILGSTQDKPIVDAFELYEEGTSEHASDSDTDEHAGESAEEHAAHSDEEAADAHAGESEEEHAGHAHGAENEHVWYDMPTVDATASAIAEQLGKLDPEGAATYTDNAEAFRAQLRQVSETTAEIASAYGGEPVAQTEPIAHYLIEAASLDNITPPEFSNAVEEGTDPSPAAIAETRDLLSDKKVRVLIYNTQTEDRVSQSIREVAEAADIPVVEVTETLPEGMDFVQWQTQTAQSLADALNAAS